MICVYKILSPDLQECYVGSTINFNRRVSEHKRKNECRSKVLFDKYGFDNCSFVILEQCSKAQLLEKEQWWLEHSFGTVNNNNPIGLEDKKYREANKEKITETARKYREENKEKVAECRKKYCEANKEKVAESHKKYYEANKEKRAETQRKYNTENKEKVAEYRKKYHEENKEANKEKRAEYQRKYRANLKSNPIL